MRTFLRALWAPFLPFVAIAVASLLIGAAAAEPATGSEPAAGPAAAKETPQRTGNEPSFRELQARLDRSDRIAALYALHLALNRVADGGTFAWSKRNRALRGIIRPTSIFRNADGQICRHVIYALSLGRYRKQIELVACREAGGRWRL
jgi:surface antigen